MSNPITAERPAQRSIPSPSDRGAIIAFMILGAAIIVWTVVVAVRRIVEAVISPTVSVLGEFAGTPAQAPIGPGGSLVEVELDRAVLSTAELPAASLDALVIGEIAVALSVTVVIVCLLLLSTSLLRGHIFSRRNTWLVGTAGVVGLMGAAASPFFSNMAANGAFAAISDREFENVIINLDLFPYLIACFIVAIIVMTFSIGERLQRETEGLV